MRLETNEAWIISKVFGEIDIFIYSSLYEPEAFHLVILANLMHQSQMTEDSVPNLIQ